MKRTTRNPEKSRKEIIEKSAPIFNQHGYEGTKMDMIIRATGFQKGGIYNHFDSKMDLARAVFQYNFSLLKKGYTQELNLSDSPKIQLLAFLKGFKLSAVNPSVKGGCPLLNMAVEADDTDETNRLLVKEALNEWKALLEQILQQGIASGDFQPDINIEQEALFMIASIEGIILLGQIKKSSRLMLTLTIVWSGIFLCAFF